MAAFTFKVDASFEVRAPTAAAAALTAQEYAGAGFEVILDQDFSGGYLRLPKSVSESDASDSHAPVTAEGTVFTFPASGWCDVIAGTAAEAVAVMNRRATAGFDVLLRGQLGEGYLQLHKSYTEADIADVFPESAHLTVGGTA